MCAVDDTVYWMGCLQLEPQETVSQDYTNLGGFHLRDVPCTFDRATVHVVNYFGSK